MIRMTSRSTGSGTGRAMMEMEKRMNDEKNASVGQIAKERYEASKAAKEKNVVATDKAQQDRFEKAREEMMKTFNSYTAMGIKSRFIGGQLYR